MEVVFYKLALLVVALAGMYAFILYSIKDTERARRRAAHRKLMKGKLTVYRGDKN